MISQFWQRFEATLPLSRHYLQHVEDYVSDINARGISDNVPPNKFYASQYVFRNAYNIQNSVLGCCPPFSIASRNGGCKLLNYNTSYINNKTLMAINVYKWRTFNKNGTTRRSKNRNYFICLEDITTQPLSLLYLECGLNACLNTKYLKALNNIGFTCQLIVSGILAVFSLAYANGHLGISASRSLLLKICLLKRMLHHIHVIINQVSDRKLWCILK
jgi:hypothetical protein